MRASLRLAALAGVVTCFFAFWILWTQPSTDLTQPMGASGAGARDPQSVSANVILPPTGKSELAAVSAEEINRLRQLAKGSPSFTILPEPDQDWVLENAGRDLKFGQVKEGQAERHIEELASIRQLKVDEREAPYFNADDEIKREAQAR